LPVQDDDFNEVLGEFSSCKVGQFESVKLCLSWLLFFPSFSSHEVPLEK